MDERKGTSPSQCRLCLDVQHDSMFDLFTDTVLLTDENASVVDLKSHQSLKLNEQVEYCTGVRIRNGTASELPSKICTKCFDFIQNWFNYRQMCINSQIYLNTVATHPETLIGDLSRSDHYWLLVAEDLQTFRAQTRKMNVAFALNVDNLREGVENGLEDEFKGELDDYTEAAIQTELDRLNTTSVLIDEEDYDIDEKSKRFNYEKQQSPTPDKSSINNIEFEELAMDEQQQQCSSSGVTGTFNPTLTEVKKAIISKQSTISTKKLAIKRPSLGQKSSCIKQEQPLRKRQCRPDSPSSYMCSECGNLYNSRSTFNYHMTLHSNVKPHDCELCGKKFRLLIELNSHMRRHTGEKPFKCRYCDRRFVDSSERIRHERVHTNTRPYSCQFCEKSFTYSSTLKNHVMIHTGIKDYHCDLCNKSFALKKNYAAHLQTTVHKQKDAEFLG